jgi:hypothetical protein
LWARIERALPLPKHFSSFAGGRLPPELSRTKSTAASEKAHFRWTLPILAPLGPCFFPADSLAHRTSRA